MKRFLPLVLLVATLAPACSAVFRQPVVTLDTFRLESIGLRGGTLVARVHVENPNGYDLRTERLDYTIEVAEADASEDAERVLVELHHRIRRRTDYLLPNIVKTLASDIDDFSCGHVLIQGIYREVASEAVFFMGTVIGHGVPAAAVRI